MNEQCEPLTPDEILRLTPDDLTPDVLLRMASNYLTPDEKERIAAGEEPNWKELYLRSSRINACEDIAHEVLEEMLDDSGLRLPSFQDA